MNITCTVKPQFQCSGNQLSDMKYQSMLIPRKSLDNEKLDDIAGHHPFTKPVHTCSVWVVILMHGNMPLELVVKKTGINKDANFCQLERGFLITGMLVCNNNCTCGVISARIHIKYILIL